MKKTFLYIVKVILFCALIFAIYSGLEYMVVDDTDSLTRITFHDFYEQSDDIDAVFIGPSHLFKGVDTQKLSEDTDYNWFSLSSSSQDLAGSYYVLKEAENNCDLKRVYLEVSIDSLVSVRGNEIKTYIISDYMKPGLNKCNYLVSTMDKSKLLNAFSPLIRNLNAIDSPFSVNSCIKVLEKKSKKKYGTYANTELTEPNEITYGGNGFWHLDVNNFNQDNDFSYSEAMKTNKTDFKQLPENFEQYQLDYLERIVSECKKNSISLTIMIPPFSDLHTASQISEYDTSIKYIQDFSEDNDVDFIDFNRVSRLNLKLNDSDFADDDHLNERGAELFEDCLADYINDRFDDYNVYKSTADRLEAEPGFYGLTYNILRSDENENCVTKEEFNKILENDNSVSRETLYEKYNYFLVNISQTANTNEVYKWNIELCNYDEDKDEMSDGTSVYSDYTDSVKLLLPVTDEGKKLSIRVSDGKENIVCRDDMTVQTDY